MNRVIHARSFRKGEREKKTWLQFTTFSLDSVQSLTLFSFCYSSFIRETLNLSIFFSSNNNMLIDDTFDFLIPDEYQRMWKYVKVWHEGMNESERPFHKRISHCMIKKEERRLNHNKEVNICWIVYDKGQIRFISMMNCRKCSCLEFLDRELDLIDMMKWGKIYGAIKIYSFGLFVMNFNLLTMLVF